ncbi:MAG: NAD(P)H-dependent oxidoreductase [Chlamydiota bacterium]|nr:NAD(P)H-dependent oxidoreductase [Chlamydiota bacterium]
MHIVLIQSSLNPHSKTSIVLKAAEEKLKEKQISYTLLDLRDIELEFCDGKEMEEYNQQLQNSYQEILDADAVIIGMPVYCYSLSGVLKNFIDITSEAFEAKKIGIIENSSGIRSYMSASHLSHILFFESDAMTISPIIHTSKEDFDENLNLKNKRVFEKLEEMIENLIR